MGLERYEITGELGAIAGRTRLAQPRDGGPPVVVKELAAGAKPGRVLRHRHVAGEIEHLAGEDGAPRWRVRDHVEGQDLGRYLEGHRFDEAEIQVIARQLLDGLVHLHQQQPPCIHGAIKPTNVIRRADGRVVLVDVGGTGAAGYVAPEQAVGRATPASDVYAVGALLLQLLSRNEPTTFPMERLKIVFRPTVTCSPALAAFVERLIEPAETDRPTAAAALRALDVLEGGGAPEVSGGRKRSLALGGAALLLLVGLGGGYVLFGRKANESPGAPPISAPPTTVAAAAVATPPATVAAQTIKVALLRDGFVPTSEGKITMPKGAFSRLSPERVEGIAKEPPAESTMRRYGALVVGQRTRFPFALEGPPGVNMVLYLDRNQNGDLTDDGPPLKNISSDARTPGSDGFTGFGASIDLPWKQIVPTAPFPGSARVWSFINRRHWEDGNLAYTTDAQLQGSVTLDGVRYLAAVAESICDLDFTNDGIIVDANGNGRLEDREWVPPGEVLRLAGRQYSFEISW